MKTNSVSLERYRKLVPDIEDIVDFYEKIGGMTIIGANESLGVPVAVKNKSREGFSEILARIFVEAGATLTYINAFSMRINKSWHIDRMLQHNLSVAEINKIRELGIGYARRNGIVEKLGIPVGLKTMYQTSEQDYDIRISDALASAQRPMFFYSCGANNIMHKLHADPISAVLNKDVRSYALRRINEEKAILHIMKDIARNFENIYSVNETTDLYCLGIYTPLLIARLRLLFPRLSQFDDFIAEYNEELKKLCAQYGAQFIDNSYLTKYCGMMGFDFHVVQEGHCLMVEKIIEQICIKLFDTKQRICVPDKPLIVDQKGLNGMIADANKDVFKALKTLGEKGENLEFYREWTSKASEYQSESAMFVQANLEVIQDGFARCRK